MLEAKTYEDVHVVPWKRVKRVWKGGLYSSGVFIPESALERVGRKSRFVGAEYTLPGDLETIRTEVLYGGLCAGAYGHFLLESLSRLWMAKQRPGIRILWNYGAGYTPWQRQIVDVLGLDNESIFVSVVVKAQRVTVPSQGYKIPSHFDKEHARFLGAVEPAPVEPGKRCWLSRSKLGVDAGAVEDEASLEDWLRSRGWEIYHPQEHPIREQLRYMSSCEVISGWEGSAFHGLILLSSLASKLIIFSRGNDLNRNYGTIAERKGFDQEIRQLPMERVSGHGNRARWRVIGGIEGLKSSLA